MKIRVNLAGHTAILQFSGVYYDNNTGTSVISTQYSNIWCKQGSEEHESLCGTLWEGKDVMIPGSWNWGGREGAHS